MSVIPWPLNPSSRAQPAAARAGAPDDVAGLAAALIQSRQTILPKRLGGPGPSAAELAQILQAAAHAPDHGQLLPWRFILVPQAARPPLADVFAQALLERDPAATAEQAEQAREKAYRSPVLLLAVVDAERGDAEIDLAYRRLISQYHPDKLAGAAPELRAQAEKKARQINAAYDRIKTLRKR